MKHSIENTENKSTTFRYLHNPVSLVNNLLPPRTGYKNIPINVEYRLTLKWQRNVYRPHVVMSIYDID